MKAKENIFTIAAYIKERYSVSYISFTKIIEGNKLVFSSRSGSKYNSLFTKLVIAKRNTVGYFMKFKALIVQSYL